MKNLSEEEKQHNRQRNILAKKRAKEVFDNDDNIKKLRISKEFVSLYDNKGLVYGLFN